MTSESALMNWLKHAFDTSGPEEPPTPAQLELVEKLCREVVRRRLALPALVFLEMSRPLNTLSAQALHFLSPMLAMFAGPATGLPSEGTQPAKSHELLAQFLERPDSVSFLSDRIDVLEKERAASEEHRDAESPADTPGTNHS